jgi:hypothetical protein
VPGKPIGNGALATIETLIIATQVGIAEVGAVRAVRAKGWIVAGSVVKGATALRVVSPVVVGITRAVVEARTKSLMLGALYKRGRTPVWRRWRRPNDVGARGASSSQQTNCSHKRESETSGPEKIH